MIIRCVEGPMDGAVYSLSRENSQPSTNRKPDGLWFDRQVEAGQWVQDQYGFDRLAEGGDHVTMVYRFGGSIPLLIPGTQFRTLPHDWCANPSCKICAAEIRPFSGDRPTQPDEVSAPIRQAIKEVMDR